jgi:hypothetical protein
MADVFGLFGFWPASSSNWQLVGDVVARLAENGEMPSARPLLQSPGRRRSPGRAGQLSARLYHVVESNLYRRCSAGPTADGELIVYPTKPQRLKLLKSQFLTKTSVYDKLCKYLKN